MEKYFKELKLAAINCLSGEYYLRKVARLQEISDAYVLRGWIKKYNNQRDLKDTSPGRMNPITKVYFAIKSGA